MMKLLLYGRQLHLLLYIIIAAGCIGAAKQRNEDCTAVAKDEETLLVFSTLGGGLTAIDPLSGETRWSIADEPAIRVPSLSQMNRHYLPDPRDGSLYTYRNPEGGLKKLPYTIPQLVASAPCRSSDGILYSGKKSDDWFLIDPKTGRRERVLGFGAPLERDKADSIGWATSRAVYLGRTQYTVMMYDSMSSDRDSRPWNVTFFDYTSHTMAPELTKEYEFLHLTSSSSGLTATFEQKKGTPLWQKDLSSPIVAVFLLGSEGLLSIPFQTVSDEVLQEINERAQDGNFDNLKLFPAVYVGEVSNNMYVIPSLVDKNTATLPSEPTVNLLGGPKLKATGELSGKELIATETTRIQNDNIIILGHYQPPKTDDSLKLDISPASPARFHKDDQLSTVLLEFNGISKKVQETKTIGVQTEDSELRLNETVIRRDISLKGLIGRMVFDVKTWLDSQPNKLPTVMFVALFGIVVFGFWYFHMQMKALQEQSQNGSQTNSNRSSGGTYAEPIDFGDGEIQVGKIVFNTQNVLGKGCEGTFVFRGSFEKREVAVKRILPGCFTLADREVALLRESDAHENVVRYFCTEQDRQFRYIAVELCAATLQDYVDAKSADTLQKQISVLEVLYQATNGLMHLHSLNIVHRDIKPQNILLSLPNNQKRVKAMISDFGLCKKLNYGKASFSRRSGVTGTDGWIAPEMQRGHRTTTSVDIFSLGCVFHYVITNGQHPFGDNLKRQANILSDEYDLRTLHKEGVPSKLSTLAEELIADMISTDQSERPPAAAIRNHPLFWSNERILSFLQDVSDRVEKLDILVEPLRTLECNARFVVREDWSLHLDQGITNDLRKYRGYQGYSVRDLLRALRNKKHHYHELTPEVQRVLGSIPNDFTHYWIDRFPRLVSHTYHSLVDHSHEPIFRSYYDEVGYRFTKPAYFSEIGNDNFDLIRYYEGAQKMKASQSPKRKPMQQEADSPQKSTRRGTYNFGRYATMSTSFISREQMIGGKAGTETADGNRSQEAEPPVTLADGVENVDKDDFVKVNYNNHRKKSNANNANVRRRENAKITWNLQAALLDE
ncbi:serine/threonine-protein kinase/endoribonuclease IRE1 [Toxorhynchites rutilus septentrionalis]|uniref:serine/threonine-protein kinase/endoribonuclease IRE1 n=1 Tax=Toxorhynchites rutilus septentrionalis TaxID=329112 RepID=UPI0024788A4E|nr:serine/threonine-protein kinase/endoribonuclease IRE1 [Toxorhynchites rutilus septentrionalis]